MQFVYRTFLLKSSFRRLFERFNRLSYVATFYNFLFDYFIILLYFYQFTKKLCQNIFTEVSRKTKRSSVSNNRPLYYCLIMSSTTFFHKTPKNLRKQTLLQSYTYVIHKTVLNSPIHLLHLYYSNLRFTINRCGPVRYPSGRFPSAGTRKHAPYGDRDLSFLVWHSISLSHL